MFGGLSNSGEYVTEGSIVIFNTETETFTQIDCSGSDTLMISALGNRCVKMSKNSVIAVVDGN
jgi:hypothetical protein